MSDMELMIAGPIDALIAINENTRDISARGIFSDVRYAQEWCTVRVDIGRQKGHTNYIAKRLADKDVVIVDDGGVFKTGMKALMKIFDNQANIDRVFEFSEFASDDSEIDINTIRRVYVDMGMANKLDAIYSKFIDCDVMPTFVVLGV